MTNNFFESAGVAKFSQAEMTNVLRLVGVRAVTATPEQIKSGLERDEPITAQHVYLEFRWEPLSYELISPRSNNLEIDGWPGYKLTKGNGLNDAQIEAVREQGYNAIPGDQAIRLLSFAGVPTDAQIQDKGKTLMQRHMAYAYRAGIVPSGTGPDGQPTFADGIIGGIFEVRGGQDVFPVPVGENDVANTTGKFYWDYENTYEKWVRYPLKRLDSFEMPANRPVFDRTKTKGDDNRPAPTASPTVAELDILQLNRALVSAGYIPGTLRTAAQQTVFLHTNIGENADTAIFGEAELQAAASEGKLDTVLLTLLGADVAVSA